MNKSIKSLLIPYYKSKPSKKKYLYGLGVLDFLKSADKELSKVFGTNLFKNVGKKAFKLAMNEYREKFCDGKARPLYDGEMHVLCSSYTGPFTVLNDKTRNYPPYNGIDDCSRTHDLDYESIGKSKMSKEEKAIAVRKADEKVLDCYDKHRDEEPYYSLAKLGISGKLTAEKILSAIRGKPSSFYGGRKKKIKSKNKKNPFNF